MVILPPVRIIVPVPLLSIAVYELLIEALSHISIFPAFLLFILFPPIPLLVKTPPDILTVPVLLFSIPIIRTYSSTIYFDCTSTVSVYSFGTR